MSKYNLLIIIFLMSGCANYINNMHKEFDNFEGRNNRTLQSTPGLETFTEGDKRYIADDFKDKSNNSSLWVGNGKENFFSTGGVRKEKGDLVTINVYTKLKEQISGELSRFYPSENSSNETAKSKPEKRPTGPSDSSSEIQDKVSVVVTKEVRDNHLILIGRKQIIYNENRHLVEVQALVHRKDITTDDTLNSNKIIQSTIKVLR
jgi:flagellar L-ring protein FlgH